MLSRRRLFQLAPSGLIVPALMGLDGTAGRSSERKFVFVYAYGGWDTTMVFTPAFGNPDIDTEADATTAEANGIRFVDHAQRPSVRRFFEQYGEQTCVVNGMEVRSVTHESCQRICMTGGSDAEADDWGVLIASNGADVYTVPHFVLDGPAFSAKYTANVVRAGESGQFGTLLDGSAMRYSEQPIKLPHDGSDALAEAYLSGRVANWTATAGRGGPQRLGDYYGRSLDNLSTLLSSAGAIDLNPEQSGCSRDLSKDLGVVWNAFESGLSRCAMIRSLGWCSTGWDTHSNNNYQVLSYEELFGFLTRGLDDLSTRTSPSGGRLADEVTIVVLSEMGRHPQITGTGRGHWTYTSFMLIGSGVQGGQVIGEMDSAFTGRPIDLASGDVTDTGVALEPNHLGATLVHLADLDPAELIEGGAPLMGALRT